MQACTEKCKCCTCASEDQPVVCFKSSNKVQMPVAGSQDLRTWCCAQLNIWYKEHNTRCSRSVCQSLIAHSHMHWTSVNFAMIVNGHHASQDGSISSINKHICGSLSLRGLGQAGGRMMHHSTKADKPTIHSNRQGCNCHDDSIAPSLAASPSATHTATQGKPASRTAVHWQRFEYETIAAALLVWLAAYISMPRCVQISSCGSW